MHVYQVFKLYGFRENWTHMHYMQLWITVDSMKSFGAYSKMVFYCYTENKLNQSN